MNWIGGYMKEFTGKTPEISQEEEKIPKDLLLPEEPNKPGNNFISSESSADADLIKLGLAAGFRATLREAAKPKHRNPSFAAVLQIIPGAGYIYLWRWGKALLTLLLFGMAYIILGLRFLRFNSAELEARQTPINADPEFDVFNLGLATPASLIFFFGILALLLVNLMGRTYRLAKLDNLNLKVTTKEELRKARGTWIDAILYFNYLALVVIILGIFQLIKDTEFNIFRLIEKSGNIGKYIGGLLDPVWPALWSPKGIMFRMRETLEISIVGTLIGAAFALVLSLLAARNLMNRNPVTNFFYYIIRVFLSMVRAVPTLFLAIIFVVSVGVGPLPAICALIIFSAGLMTKLFSEAIEAIDWGQVEAVQAAGGSTLHVIIFSVVPQVVPYYISHMLYSWEVNVHSASVLGLVGAGGIGEYVRDAIESYKYPQLGTALIVVIIATVTIDFSSAYIRSRIV